MRISQKQRQFIFDKVSPDSVNPETDLYKLFEEAFPGGVHPMLSQMDDVPGIELVNSLVVSSMRTAFMVGFTLSQFYPTILKDSQVDEQSN